MTADPDAASAMNDFIRGVRRADDPPAADMNDFIRTGRRFALPAPAETDTTTKEPDAAA